MTKRSDFFIKIAVVAVAIFAVTMLILMRVRISQFETEREELIVEMSSYEQKIKELEEKLTMPDSAFTGSDTESGGGK